MHLENAYILIESFTKSFEKCVQNTILFLVLWIKINMQHRRNESSVHTVDKVWVCCCTYHG